MSPCKKLPQFTIPMTSCTFYGFYYTHDFAKLNYLKKVGADFTFCWFK